MYAPPPPPPPPADDEGDDPRAEAEEGQKQLVGRLTVGMQCTPRTLWPKPEARL